MDKSKCYMLWDAQMDCLRGLNQLTDMENPPVDKICALAKAIKDLQCTMYYMHKTHVMMNEPDMPELGTDDTMTRTASYTEHHTAK